MTRACSGAVGVLLTTLLLAGCGDAPQDPAIFAVRAGDVPEPVMAEPCRNNNPGRNAYFGDTHVHTSWSSDSYMFGVRLTPDDAYRYAFGGEVSLPVEGAAGRSDGSNSRLARIDRPLDFMAVTDHAETLGEMALCTDPDSEVYDAGLCRNIREDRGRAPKLIAQIMWPFTFRFDEVCGADSGRCLEASADRWQQTIAAAQRWHDTSSDCSRTTFIAFEYSSFRLGSNLHRNVIFRNNVVLPVPISYVEAPRAWDLWAMLKTGCLDSGTGCDVMAIPHNSNISNGRMFNVEYPGLDTVEEKAARNRLRMAIEPLVEVMQHKGDSECRDGVPGILNSEDELCRFEKFADWSAIHRFGKENGFTDDDTCPEGGFADSRPHLGPDCVSRLNFVRYALIEGLLEEQATGVNPFKFGLSAATDTHNAIGGGVEERSFPGHLGVGDDTVADRVSWDSSPEGNTSNNPGGLFGVWAQENSRDSLFDAMRRKEVFGTSGPRIRPRLFAGAQFPGGICASPDWVALADAAGVPMGGDLNPANLGEAAPSLLVAATADAGTSQFPGTPLQRLQVIKGWVDQDGQRRSRVYDVAGDPENRASVDTKDCSQQGSGFAQLCTVWQDPDFDPDVRAVYYMRAVENPSCRYNAWQCVGLTGEDRPASCDAPDAPKIIQERAWTSPIWYTPQES